MSCRFIVARVPDCLGMHKPHFRRGEFLLLRGDTLASKVPAWRPGFSLCSARLQAGKCLHLQCRPEGRRYKFGPAKLRTGALR